MVPKETFDLGLTLMVWIICQVDSVGIISSKELLTAFGFKFELLRNRLLAHHNVLLKTEKTLHVSGLV